MTYCKEVREAMISFTGIYRGNCCTLWWSTNAETGEYFNYCRLHHADDQTLMNYLAGNYWTSFMFEEIDERGQILEMGAVMLSIAVVVSSLL